MKIRWPAGTGRAACIAAGVVAAGDVLGHGGPWGVMVAAGLAVAAVRKRAALAVLLVIAAIFGGAAATRNSMEQIDVTAGSGTATFEAVVLSDPVPALRGWSFVVRASGGPLMGAPVAVSSDRVAEAAVGSRVRIAGRFVPGASRLHRVAIAGRVTARSIEVLGLPTGPMAIANAVRGRVHEQFPDDDVKGALMRGFLIGDTSSMDATTLEEMRRSGLLHFVAVSGGNVAIFLAGVWLLFGLVPMSPRLRAFIGLLGIILFVLVTRWEPSVLRAGVMLGLLLAGRLAGVPVDGWTALGGAATLLLLVAPQLVFDIGFQLSAVATAGLLAGSHLWNDRKPTFLWRSLGATVAAQIAVTPLLLWTFGSVPAFSAVANVVAAPLVTIGTASGWGRVFVGLPGLDVAAELAAAVVLEVSTRAAQLPQVGWLGLILVVAVLALIRWRTSAGLIVAALSLVAVSLTPGPPPVATVVFLDVGQGDALLLLSPEGEVVAIDTGPDPVGYLAALRRHGVSHINLLVLTHSDRDHVGGMDALADRVTVDEVWYPDFTAAEEWDVAMAAVSEVPSRSVRSGRTRAVGSFGLAVVSPGRRFAADNDSSIVLWVEVNGVSLLLTGDIESVGQGELPELAPDLMLVPHHGSATSDLDWLERTAGPLVVLSYGDNSYGHPAPIVTERLAGLASTVLTTEMGDVVVTFPGAGRMSLAE